MLIATDTRADPNTLPTTVGMVEKKPPLEMPLTMTNKIMGASVVETGQMARTLTADKNIEANNTLRAPKWSQRTPQQMRPMAEEKLKPATRPAPVEEESPMDFE